MNAPAPRLRMFAGPNGSGKSTIKDMLPSPWLGVYINADEMEKTIRADGFLDLRDFEVDAGVEIEMKTNEMPAWFKAALWDKF